MLKPKEKPKKRWVLPALFLTAALGCSMAVGGIFAYMTHTDDSINIFTIGDVHIKAWEPNFPTEDTDGNNVPDECELMVPYETISKDPRIKNTGTNDAIVFFKVTAPVEVVNLVGDDGSRSGKKDADLFWFKLKEDSDNIHANHFRDGWVELTSLDNQFVECAECNDEGKGYTYIFGWHVRLGAGETTQNLFDKVQNKKYGSETIDPEEIEQIRIEAYAVQADDILKNGQDVDTSGELSEETLTYIYQIFINQNAEALTGN